MCTACSNTVSRCGVFCSLTNATECCKTEGIVDVFQVVKALRIQKPGSVLTVVSLSRLYIFVAGCVVASSIVAAKQRFQGMHY